MSKVSKAKFASDLKTTIVRAVDGLGGFKKFINKGEVVLLKPNFNTADPFPASTDFTFLKTMVELVYEQGAKLVMIGESSTMSCNTRKIMEKLGIFDLLKNEPLPRIYLFDEMEWVKKQIQGAKYLKSVSVPKIIERPDKIIFLPCLKTHFLAQYTGALKLAVGFIKPYQRVGLHLRHIQEKIAELNKIIKCDLVIMDARTCFINKGPAEGEIAKPNLIMASESRVEIDIEGVKIIKSYPNNSLAKLEAQDLPQIKLAQEIGIK